MKRRTAIWALLLWLLAGAAYVYLQQHAAELGIDPHRVVLAGGSAGGHIAAGNRCELSEHEGVGHGFQNWGGGHFDEVMAETVNFAREF